MRGHVRKRGSRWAVVLYLGYDATGKKKYKWISGFSTKKEAEKYLATAAQEIHEGTYVDPSNEPFAEYLNRWLDYKRGLVRPRTCEIYARTLRLHVVPRLGRIPLSDLKPFHLRDLYTYLQRNKQLSNRYIGQIHTMLHDALDTALKWELVPRNVADHVEPPKASKKKFNVWSIDEVRRFLNAPEVREHRFYVAFLLALTTGMRLGEILALKWQDIDFENATLEVKRTITYLNGRPNFGPPKSESAERVITLPAEVVEALRQHRVRQNQERLQMGSAYQNHDLVIARINGNVVTQAFLRHKFIRLINKLGMPYIRFHDMRHTHSSILLELGENMKTLQERLGHANYQITADTYTHVSRTLQTRPALLLSKALFDSGKK